MVVNDAVYDKYDLLSIVRPLMMAGINERFIISTPHDLPNFKKVIGRMVYVAVNSVMLSKRFKWFGATSVMGEEFIGSDDVTWS
jgi:glucose-1-phosphate thymidylyltransferase